MADLPKIDYRQRMNSYYPEVIRSIYEFQAIIDGDYPEFEKLAEATERITQDAYLLTMSEERIKQWEQAFQIKPHPQATLQDRREVIIARIKGQGKLNTATINAIVNTFTGGSAISWVEDSTLYVAITPPRDNKQYLFPSVEQELSRKVPAHLNFKVERNYYVWEDIKNHCETWQDVLDEFGIWNEVYLFVPFSD